MERAAGDRRAGLGRRTGDGLCLGGSERELASREDERRRGGDLYLRGGGEEERRGVTERERRRGDGDRRRPYEFM